MCQAHYLLPRFFTVRPALQRLRLASHPTEMPTSSVRSTENTFFRIPPDPSGGGTSHREAPTSRAVLRTPPLSNSARK